MNERIKQLAEQATVIRKTFHGVEHVEFDKEKFAKLIAKECMTLCEDVTERNDPAIACYYEIKRHFGVEK